MIIHHISVSSVLNAIVPISRFNRGEANKIFEEVSQNGFKIVVKISTDLAPLYCQHPGRFASTALPSRCCCQTCPDVAQLTSRTSINDFPGGSSVLMQVECYKTSFTNA